MNRIKLFSQNYLIYFVYFIVLFLVSKYCLTYYPNTGDEFSIYFQSKTFSQFQLYSPSLPNNLAKYISPDYIIFQDNKWFSQYPPIYSILLSIGHYIHHPLFIVFIVSILNILLIRKILNQYLMTDATVNNLIIFAIMISPTYFFHSISYYNHMGELLIYLMSLYFFGKYLDNFEIKNILFFSLLSGLGIGIRPYTTFLLATPIFAILSLIILKNRKFNHFFLLYFPFTALLCLLLGYNYLLTGNIFQITYLNAGNNIEHISISLLNSDSVSRILSMMNNSYKWLFSSGLFEQYNLKSESANDHNFGMFFFIVAITYLCYLVYKNRFQKYFYFYLVLILNVLFLIIGHLIVNLSNGRFGERFFFETQWIIFSFFILAIWKLLEKIPYKIYIFGIIWFLPTLFLYLPNTAKFFRNSNLERMDLYLKTNDQSFSNAMIHIHSTKEFSPRFYTRNNPDLSGPIYVEFTPEFEILKINYPNKKHYFYFYHPEKDESFLKPINENFSVYDTIFR